MIEHIIHDTTPNDLLFPRDKGRGLDLSQRPPGMAYGGVADPFPSELLIPRSEWQARIQELEETKTRISDLCDFRGIVVKDQAQTNYCWCNAPTHCTEIIRAVQNQPHVSLSPASAAAQITNYENANGNPAGVGGYGLEALKWMIENGLVPSSDWPDNAISPKYATPDNRKKALLYRPDEWWELEPNNLDQLISCLLMRYPVSVGLDWWGHQVTYVDPVWLDGTAAIRIDNSWGTSWGTNGRSVLQGRRMLPSDATSPRTAIAA